MKTSAKHVEVFTFVHRGKTVHLFCADEKEALRARVDFIKVMEGRRAIGTFWLWCIVHHPFWWWDPYTVFEPGGVYSRRLPTETSAIEYVLDEMDDRSGGGE